MDAGIADAVVSAPVTFVLETPMSSVESAITLGTIIVELIGFVSAGFAIVAACSTGVIGMSLVFFSIEGANVVVFISVVADVMMATSALGAINRVVIAVALVLICVEEMGKTVVEIKVGPATDGNRVLEMPMWGAEILFIVVPTILVGNTVDVNIVFVKAITRLVTTPVVEAVCVLVELTSTMANCTTPASAPSVDAIDVFFKLLPSWCS